MFSGHCRYGHSVSESCDESITSLVKLLICPWYPAAVFRGVRTIIVNSLDGMAIGPDPHVSKKIVKAIFPSVADLNSSTAVVFVFFSMLGIAATSHFNPASMGWGVGQSMPLVTATECAGVFKSGASARFRAPSDYVPVKSDFFGPAFAAAKSHFSSALKHRPFVVCHGDNLPWIILFVQRKDFT